MYINDNILMAKNEDEEFYLNLKMANRHGIIAGGTGSGKTITLKVMAEGFSDAGVPVFLADVKGDLSGMCIEGEDNENIQKRIEKFKLNDFNLKKYPTEFYEIDRVKGLPIRTTISEFGPILFSNILNLNQTQSDILNVVFKIADDNGLLLLDLKDLKKLLEYVGDNPKEFANSYGNVSKVSTQSILRNIISLEQQGIDKMFGEPDFNISDLLRCDNKGKGYISILHSESLMLSPKVYSSFMLWLLSEIYENMPEVGDLEKPKLVFFFDEAHLLFNDSNSILLKKIEQMAKLIRSKGIGLYFITQDPNDIPNTILQQLGNKVQHVYRAYTAKDKKNQRAIVDSFRENKDLNLIEILDTLGTGEALVSFLDDKGIPNVVKKANILPPQSKMGIIDDNKRREVMMSSLLYNKYINDIDRESAYEILLKNVQARMLNNDILKSSRASKKTENATAKAVKSILKSSGSSIGREVSRSIATSIFGNNTYAKNVAGNIGSSLVRNILGTLTK